MGITRTDCILGYGHGWARACRRYLAKGASALDLRWIAYTPCVGFPGDFAGQYSNRWLASFAPAGLACSAFFPLSISFGGEEFPRLTAVISGELIAFYQVGYGIAAFGTGWLLGATHIPLSTIYVGASLVAGVMIILAFLVIRLQSSNVAKMNTECEKENKV